MPWEDVQSILRPEKAHMGVMGVDKDKCTGCGLCIQNCPFKAWEMGEDKCPKLKDPYECFSCYNCMVVCPVEAISIIEPYHVDDGFWKTDSAPLEARMPWNQKTPKGTRMRGTSLKGWFLNGEASGTLKKILCLNP